MSEADWYQVANGPDLMQGDIILQCPIIKPATPWPIPHSDAQPVEVRADVVDVAVVTQSCDLENAKVTEVLVAKVTSYDELVREHAASGNTMTKSSGFRKLCVQGNLPGYTLLRAREQPPALPWSLVDFHQLYTVPKSYLEAHAAVRQERLRLNSPYRENFSQAFGAYFMRVGLPQGAKDFEKYQPI